MGRYDRRIQRLEQQVKGRYSSLSQARVARMSYEEVVAELVVAAVKHGLDEAQAQADPEAAVTWLSNYLRAAEEALPKEEREE